jgi:hypothetical protein
VADICSSRSRPPHDINRSSTGRNLSGKLTLQEVVDRSFEIKDSFWTSSWHSRRVEDVVRANRALRTRLLLRAPYFGLKGKGPPGTRATRLVQRLEFRRGNVVAKIAGNDLRRARSVVQVHPGPPLVPGLPGVIPRTSAHSSLHHLRTYSQRAQIFPLRRPLWVPIIARRDLDRCDEAVLGLRYSFGDR